MAKRPPLSEDAFLRFVFRPKSNPMPTGMRKRHVSSTRGRNSRRVAAFNKLSPAQQRILDRTGNREKYLKGEVNLSEAKRQLRGVAERTGVFESAKSLKQRGIANILARAEEREVTPKTSAIKPQTVEENANRWNPTERKIAARLTYPELKALASDKNLEEVDTDTGEIYNPYWYK